MSIVSLLSCAAAAIGVSGQWLDGFSTWEGVKKFGPGIEGDKSWFAQLLVKHPPLLLFVKPLILTVVEGALIYAGPHTNGGGYAVAILAGGLAAALGFYDAIGNFKINKAK